MNLEPDIDIDARGLACPLPVIRVKQRVEEKKSGFTVLVDNDAARENVARFSRAAGCTVEVSGYDGCHLLRIEPGIGPPLPESRTEGVNAPAGAATLILVGRDVLGDGERELGEVLMRSFLFTCAESNHLPAAVVFMNSGVRLVTENDEAASSVRRMEEGGVEVIACGTCLDYYGLKESLKVGRVGNMYEIHSMLIAADHLVSI